MEVSDDVLGCILERIDSIVSLIHAASACKQWRRIVADRGFLRRFGGRHASKIAAGDCSNHRAAYFPVGV